MCISVVDHVCLFFFFFHDSATTEIYTLSLHDALPIWVGARQGRGGQPMRSVRIRILATLLVLEPNASVDRKSTRLNSSHLGISYAVFCLKKKKTKKTKH